MKGFLLLIFALGLFSCKYSFSPYTVEVPKLLENEAQLRRIRKEEVNLPTEYRIAFISDTHNYYDDLSDLVKHINQAGPFAFIVVTGDITNEGLREEYLKTNEILNRLNFPVLVVIGNHDLLSNGETIYSKLYGPHNFVLRHRDITFVFANNNNWESGGEVPDYDFIGDSFAEATTPNRILVTHVAPDDKDRYTRAEIERLENIITSHGVDFILNGHNHNPGESVFAGATQITVGAPTKRRYWVLSITAGGISYEKIPF